MSMRGLGKRGKAAANPGGCAAKKAAEQAQLSVNVVDFLAARKARALVEPCEPPKRPIWPRGDEWQKERQAYLNDLYWRNEVADYRRYKVAAGLAGGVKRKWTASAQFWEQTLAQHVDQCEHRCKAGLECKTANDYRRLLAKAREANVG